MYPCVQTDLDQCHCGVLWPLTYHIRHPFTHRVPISPTSRWPLAEPCENDICLVSSHWTEAWNATKRASGWKKDTRLVCSVAWESGAMQMSAAA